MQNQIPRSSVTDDFEAYSRVRFQKRQIRTVGSCLGLAIICYVIVSTVFSALLVLFGKFNAYATDSVLQFSLDIIVTLIAILLPFKLMGVLIEKRTALPASAPIGAPEGGFLLSLSAVFFGLGLCMVGNIITGYIVSFSKIIGHEFTSPDLNFPSGFSGFILSIVRIALIAALCEEIAFRGTALQPLRKYGLWFAVICSSCVFAIMHGNLVQAPFALIAGIGFGWICIKTGSIWPTFIIHFLNNLFSVAISYLISSESVSEELALKIESAILYTLIALGVFFGFLFIKRARNIPTDYGFVSDLSAAQKAVAFFVNIPMIAAIAYMVYVTVTYIK